jgi:alpha-L-rhamnosidase
VNGVNVTGSAQVPRWTPQDLYTEYQVYDATEYLQQGTNQIGAIISDGHFRGRNNFLRSNNCYGNRLAYYCLLHIELMDSSHITFSSNEEWEVSTGPILRSDPMEGEIVDLRIPRNFWEPDPTLSQHYSFQPVDIITSSPTKAFIAEETGPVEEVSRLKATRVWRSPSGKQLIDFGQNFTGVVRIRLSGGIGNKVVLMHSEVLDRNGELNKSYINPIGQDTIATDEIILSGDTEWFQPMFTIRGFRYVEVSGLSPDETLQGSNIEGIVLSSRFDSASEFICSNPLLEQLYKNTWWSFKSNFISTPTDCPTRERAGWTGDIQVFSPTAMLMADVQGYLHRYLRNLGAEQYEDGRIPPYIPSGDSEFSGYGRLNRWFGSSAGWGDASVFIPWQLYQHYGDVQILEKQYDSMKRWVDFLETTARTRSSWRRWILGGPAETEKFIVDTGFHWGEWLRPGENSMYGMTKGILIWPSAAVPTAYLAESSRILSDAAAILKKEKEASYYSELSKKVREAWAQSFI